MDMDMEMKLLEMDKRIAELEYRQIPKPEELEIMLKLMKQYDVQELSFGMLRISLRYKHVPLGANTL